MRKNNITKAIFALILAALTVFSFASCTGGVKETDTEPPATEQAPADNEEENKTEKPTEKPKESETDPPIPEDKSLLVMSQNFLYKDSDEHGTVIERYKRFSLLVEEYSPDIIGGQEATFSWFSNLRFLNGYGIVSCSRNGFTEAEGERSPILYKKARFDLKDSGTFWLTETPDEVSVTEGANLPRICTWALLYDKYTGESVMMFNTHLDNSTDEVRAEQVKHLVENAEKIIAKQEKVDGVYLTGDFNFTPSSAPYAKLTAKGFVNTKGVAEKNLSSKEGSYHRFDPESSGREIDFCFYKGEEKVLSYEIISKSYKGANDSEADFISDHYAVAARFAN